MTIIIRCADPRINAVIEKLCGEQKNGYAVISNTGSIKFFIDDHLDDLLGQINILTGLYDVDKLIIMNHTECGYYMSLGEAKLKNYIEDLTHLKTKLSRVIDSKIEVEAALINTENGTLEYL